MCKGLTLNELRVLSVLEREESYGLAIIKKINNSYEPPKKIFNQGSIYNLLQTLERKGLTRSKVREESHRTGRKKIRHYTITEEGKRLLKEERDFFISLWFSFNFGV